MKQIRIHFTLFSALISTLISALILVSAGQIFGDQVTDRFGNPLHPADVFPMTLEPFHPLNPADLAQASHGELEFGDQAHGSDLILGMPNFIVAITEQDLQFPSGTAILPAYGVKKYELGYGVSTADLGWSKPDAPFASLGGSIRYLNFTPDNGTTGNSFAWAYADVGMSLWVHRLRLDGAVLNLGPLNQPNGVSLGRQSREYNFGAGYGPKGNWLAYARLGYQDTATSLAIVDVGFEKLFFGNVTFRVGTQRRYLTGSNISTRQAQSALSGGIWYRFTKVGLGYHYPEKDGDLFSVSTLLRLLNNVQFGGLMTLVNDYASDGNQTTSNTALFLTLGKSF